MCDTFVSAKNYSKNKTIIFGKNSDREPNEAQAIVKYPARDCLETDLKCTYITIPQVKHTYAVILSKPFWMWGAEMGINEHGLVIGNEAVFSRLKVASFGLTGMDLIRLALERTKNAKEALSLITDLINIYGQGGNGAYKNNLFYFNSFIIADKNSACVLRNCRKTLGSKVD